MSVVEFCFKIIGIQGWLFLYWIEENHYMMIDLQSYYILDLNRSRLWRIRRIFWSSERPVHFCQMFKGEGSSCCNNQPFPHRLQTGLYPPNNNQQRFAGVFLCHKVEISYARISDGACVSRECPSFVFRWILHWKLNYPKICCIL